MNPSSLAGVITAFATVLTALGGLVLAVSVLIPTMVAARAAVKVAQSAADSAEATAARVEATSAEHSVQLKSIHTLVNSSLTAAIRAEYEATRQQAIMMREAIELHRALGRDPTEAVHAELAVIDERVAELGSVVEDRVRQTTIADAIGKQGDAP
jgi:hypothetical protein